MIPQMAGGGAERVLGILADAAAERGYNTTLMLTSQRVKEAVGYKLRPEVELTSLIEMESSPAIKEKCRYFFQKQYSRLFGTLLEKLKMKVPDHIAHATFIAQYSNKVKALREYLLKNPEAEIITFCQPAVNIALLAADGLPNRVILSERLDPARYSHNRYMPYFVKKWYPTAKHIVFQSEGAQSWFDESIKAKSSVIFNPLKPGLPEPSVGERSKTIVTFCRITSQKNLPLLVDAFAAVSERHPEYSLRIYGEGESKAELVAYIQKIGLENKIHLLPFDPSLHEKIKASAMYVNSSDYEGMSNAMLEAMAIGLPVVCTDCPAGGARAIIKDHENGLLTPVGDMEALAAAMLEIIENPGLADKLSRNAVKLREELSVDKIVEKWMELL